ncbi:MAG: hypothetical protein MZU97_15575 [Bacillus subtilis]|nr:hypothetical protein [Bacillus subtilis]
MNETDQDIRVRMLFEKQPPAFIFSKNVVVPDLFFRLGERIQASPSSRAPYRDVLALQRTVHLSAGGARRARDAPRRPARHQRRRRRDHRQIRRRQIRSRPRTGPPRLHARRRRHRRSVPEVEKGIVIGEAPDLLKKYLEIRGIGIVNVVYLFGVRAYRESKRISMIVNLDKWDDRQRLQPPRPDRRRRGIDLRHRRSSIVNDPDHRGAQHRDARRSRRQRFQEQAARLQFRRRLQRRPERKNPREREETGGMTS